MDIILSNTISQQKCELYQLKKNLVFFLQNKLYAKKDIFLIDKDWLDDYSKIFFFNRDKNELSLNYKKFKNNYNTKLNKEINEYSEFYILNDKCWYSFFKNGYEELKIICEGYFLNKILLIIKEPIIFFLYLDNNKDIKKGYFIINNNNEIKQNIIDYFKQRNPFVYQEHKDSFFYENINYKILEGNSIFNIKINNESKLNANYSSFNTSSYINKKKLGVEKSVNNPEFSLKSFRKEKEIKIVNQIYNNNLCGRINNNKIPKNFAKEYKENKNMKMDINLIPQNSKENEDINIKINNNIGMNNNNIGMNNNNFGINNNIGMSKKSNKNSNFKKNDIFDPETKIIKRNPSVRQNKMSKFNIFKNNDDNNYLNDILPKAIHRLSTPGVIGLSNKGGFSCMNAVIQCLSNISRLRIELISKDFYKELENNKLNNTKLSFSFAEVLKNLWENLNQRTYDHKNFINIIYNINPNFDKIYDEPKKIIIFLFDNIHKELNIPKINNNNELSYFLFQNNINRYNIDFNSFKKDFENKNNSIITREFNGYSNIIQGCFYCNLKSETFENFEILNFSLDEIRKFKGYNFNYVNIYECFEYYVRKEYFPKNCNNCGKNIINFKELFMPQTLIVNFEYQKDLQNNVNVVYEEYLNLKKYIRFNNNNSPYYYELVGVICCPNSNEKLNHYISFCKNSNNCEWYQYNDNKVTKSSFKEINGQPYTLFFSYIQI